jgi:hypothetical protein
MTSHGDRGGPKRDSVEDHAVRPAKAVPPARTDGPARRDGPDVTGGPAETDRPDRLADIENTSVSPRTCSRNACTTFSSATS